MKAPSSSSGAFVVHSTCDTRGLIGLVAMARAVQIAVPPGILHVTVDSFIFQVNVVPTARVSGVRTNSLRLPTESAPRIGEDRFEAHAVVGVAAQSVSDYDAILTFLLSRAEILLHTL